MRRCLVILALILPYAAAKAPLLAAEPATGAMDYDPMPSPDLNHTRLHRAAEKCDAGAATSELGAHRSADKKKEINRLDREGYRPLGYAAQSGCLEIAQMLLDAGAAVDLTDPHSNWTPLLRAAEGRHADVVRLLAKKGAMADGSLPDVSQMRRVFPHDDGGNARDSRAGNAHLRHLQDRVPGRFGGMVGSPGFAET